MTENKQVVRYAITIDRPPAVVYAFWRDLPQLPQFTRHLIRVEELGGGRSRWTTEGPGGAVSWDAEIVEDVPGDRLSWRSVEGSTIENEGSVELTPAPGGNGTEVRVSIAYAAPMGKVGVAAAKMTGNEPKQQIAEAMRRIKGFLETGGVAVIEGQPSNQKRGDNVPGEEGLKVGAR